MRRLKRVCIPSNIRNLEYNENENEFTKILGQIKDLSANHRYFEVFQTAIHLEQVAMSKRLMEYDMNSVLIKVDQNNLTFEPVKSNFIHYYSNFIDLFILIFFIALQNCAFDKQKYVKACKEKLLSKFTIFVDGFIHQYEGLLKLSKNSIQFKVLNGFERLIWHDLRIQRFSVNFISNSTSSSIQHNAVAWMKEDGLFEQLIANSRYDAESSITDEPNHNEFAFW